MSFPPTITPPIIIKKMQRYWSLLKLWGKLNNKAISKTKKTVNFLKAIKAAKGKIVTQYDDKIFVVHITIA